MVSIPLYPREVTTIRAVRAVGTIVTVEAAV